MNWQKSIKRLCNGESDLQIMSALCLQERNYYKYKKRLEKRLMEYQNKKTNDTIFMETQLFKHRMLNLYKGLERIVITIDENVSGMERAKCAKIAANIAIDVLKMESESIKAVKEGLAALTNKKNNTNLYNNNSHHNHQLEKEEENDNRKF